MTQDEQVECFANVATHLEPGGHFVVGAFVPELRRLPPGETVRAFTVSPTRLGFGRYDVVAQTLVSHHYWVGGDRLETFFSSHRYAWPSELDLMARLAGMTLQERWSDWDRATFTSDSTTHVSVWQKRDSRSTWPARSRCRRRSSERPSSRSPSRRHGDRDDLETGDGLEVDRVGGEQREIVDQGGRRDHGVERASGRLAPSRPQSR